MDPQAVFAAVLAIFTIVGAMDLIPFIVQKALSLVTAVLKVALTEFSDFVVWYRKWKADLWPPPRSPVDNPS